MQGVSVSSGFRNLSVLSYLWKAAVLKVFPTFPHTPPRASQSQRESTAHCCLYPHINELTRTIYAYMFQRSLRSVSYGGVVPTSARSQLSSGEGSPVMCVRFLTCAPIEPHGCHQRSATETQTHFRTKKAEARKPSESQKWHNGNNERRLHAAEDVEGCPWPSGKLVFILLPGLHRWWTKKSKEVTCVWLGSDLVVQSYEVQPCLEKLLCSDWILEQRHLRHLVESQPTHKGWSDISQVACLQANESWPEGRPVALVTSASESWREPEGGK